MQLTATDCWSLLSNQSKAPLMPPVTNRAFAKLKECGCNSVVECQLPKLNVAGSSPVTRLLNFLSSIAFANQA